MTDGMAALHQAIVGDRLRLALDATLAREVLGSRPVLDCHRCAMLPLRDAGERTGHDDSFESIAAELDPRALRQATAGWRIDVLAARAACSQSAAETASGGVGRLARVEPGTRWRVEGADVVSAAPELARLTLNVAAVHHDRDAHDGGRRLVYGGHTIGLAAAQATRSLPELATFVGWHSCEHLGPVHEGDTLRSVLELERHEPLPRGGALAHLRSRVSARRDAGDTAREVLDWRFVALAA